MSEKKILFFMGCPGCGEAAEGTLEQKIGGLVWRCPRPHCQSVTVFNIGATRREVMCPRCGGTGKILELECESRSDDPESQA